MKIVLPLFQFYPYKGVGANRWNNLSRHLGEKYQIEVWTIKREGINNNLYKKINFRFFKTDPITKLSELSFTNKIINLLYKKILSTVLLFFFPTDPYEYWSLFLKDAIVEEISKGSLFILTGGPFSVQSNLVKILKKNNYKNYILDFRDPWTKDPHRIFLNYLVKRKQEKEEEVLLKENDIKKVFVTKTLFKNMKTKPKNTYVIKNGHDFPITSFLNFFNEHESKKNISYTKIIYLGTIGSDRADLFINFIEMIKDSKERIEITVYGRVALKILLYLQNFKRKNKYIDIKIKNNIERSYIKRISKRYNIALQITSDSYPYALSTKVYEYPALGLPQLCICNRGEIKNLINNNKIGKVINLKESKSSVLKKIEYLKKEIYLEDLYNFSKLSSWSKRAENYEQLIESIKKKKN